jgi:hypothetical protein
MPWQSHNNQKDISMDKLTQRIQHLEDREDIRNLKYYYGHCVDRVVAGESTAIDETISCFAKNIVAERIIVQNIQP